jgi:hypothetical protein
MQRLSVHGNGGVTPDTAYGLSEAIALALCSLAGEAAQRRMHYLIEAFTTTNEEMLQWTTTSSLRGPSQLALQ